MKSFNGMVRGVALGAVSAAIAMAATPAFASNPPTLHGFCASAHPCSDNGTNTPTSVNPPVFSFSAGGHSATGDVLIDILVPDNLAQPGSFTVSGALVGSNTFLASLVSTTAWTTGDLDTYLGISASPTNPIGAYLPTTQTYQSTATGFWVYQANIGTVTLPSNNGASDSSLLTINHNLALGSYVTAFINQSGNYGATANSGAILETGRTPPPSVPEPATWAMMIVGFGAAGVAIRRRKPAMAALRQLA
jgi:hypothetical protein